MSYRLELPHDEGSHLWFALIDPDKDPLFADPRPSFAVTDPDKGPLTVNEIPKVRGELDPIDTTGLDPTIVAGFEYSQRLLKDLRKMQARLREENQSLRQQEMRQTSPAVIVMSEKEGLFPQTRDISASRK